MANIRILLRAAVLATVVVAFSGGAAGATDFAGEETVLACPVQGRDRAASVSVSGNRAIYRYGRPQGEPELTLSTALGSLFRRIPTSKD